MEVTFYGSQWNKRCLEKKRMKWKTCFISDSLKVFLFSLHYRIFNTISCYISPFYSLASTIISKIVWWQRREKILIKFIPTFNYILYQILFLTWRHVPKTKKNEWNLKFLKSIFNASNHFLTLRHTYIDIKSFLYYDVNRIFLSSIIHDFLYYFSFIRYTPDFNNFFIGHYIHNCYMWKEVDVNYIQHKCLLHSRSFEIFIKQAQVYLFFFSSSFSMKNILLLFATFPPLNSP